MKKLLSVQNTVTIGLFAAVCYVSLYFMIPIPSPVGKPFLHLGNLFVILAALLFGGIQGGLAGSIGMGLFDAFNGYADTCVKTFLLKFGIGLFVGLVAALGKKDGVKSPRAFLGILSAFFLIGGAAAWGVAIKTGGTIAVEGLEKPLTLPPVLYIFSLLLGVLLAAAVILSKKLTIEMQYATLGAVCGILFNLIGEFVFGVLFKMMAGSALTPAVIASAISLPATIINGTFSIVGAMLLYMPMKRAMRRGALQKN